MTKKIIIKETEHVGDFFVEKTAYVADLEKDYRRFSIERPDCVAVLLYNVDSDSVVLVRQFRYPAYEKLNPIQYRNLNKENKYPIEINSDNFLYEAVAGKIDVGETPEQAVVRETMEEVGYKIKEKSLIHCRFIFMSPGYSSERIYFYLSIVNNSMKKELGGGVKDENEDIEVVEMPFLQFKSYFESGGIKDAKTKLLAFEAFYRRLFDEKKPEAPKIVKKEEIKENKNQLKLL